MVFGQAGFFFQHVPPPLRQNQVFLRLTSPQKLHPEDRPRRPRHPDYNAHHSLHQISISSVIASHNPATRPFHEHYNTRHVSLEEILCRVERTSDEFCLTRDRELECWENHPSPTPL